MKCQLFLIILQVILYSGICIFFYLSSSRIISQKYIFKEVVNSPPNSSLNVTIENHDIHVITYGGPPAFKWGKVPDTFCISLKSFFSRFNFLNRNPQVLKERYFRQKYKSFKSFSMNYTVLGPRDVGRRYREISKLYKSPNLFKPFAVLNSISHSNHLGRYLFVDGTDTYFTIAFHPDIIEDKLKSIVREGDNNFIVMGSEDECWPSQYCQNYRQYDGNRAANSGLWIASNRETAICFLRVWTFCMFNERKQEQGCMQELNFQQEIVKKRANISDCTFNFYIDSKSDLFYNAVGMSSIDELRLSMPTSMGMSFNLASILHYPGPDGEERTRRYWDIYKNNTLEYEDLSDEYLTYHGKRLRVSDIQCPKI